MVKASLQGDLLLKSSCEVVLGINLSTNCVALAYPAGFGNLLQPMRT